MKGLLIKDLLLLEKQKRFYLIVVFMGLMLTMTAKGNYSFALGYINVLFSMVVMTTISYDEMDHGMAFLLTIPADRKTYLTEKYVLLFISAAAGALLSIVIFGVASLVGGEEINFIEALQATCVFVPVVFLYAAIMIPIQIQFGAEKARIVLFAVFAIAMILGFGVDKIGGEFMAGTFQRFGQTLNQNDTLFIAMFCMFGVVGLGISYLVSYKILMKKEY